MKKIILLLITIFTLSGCDDKNDSPKRAEVAELDKLPPATQTGRNTVGCLLDGKAFLPRGFNATNCFYQYVNGGYYFVIGFYNRDSKSNLTSLAVGAQQLQIHQGGTYNLVEFAPHNADGAYTYKTYESFTSQEYTGKLIITKLDPINGIVSGTFWYDIKDYNGVVHQIREGRFDMHYTN